MTECEGCKGLREALEPFAKFAEAFDAQPIRGLHDEMYNIHTGTQWEASLRLSDCRRASHVLRPAPPGPAKEHAVYNNIVHHNPVPQEEPDEQMVERVVKILRKWQRTWNDYDAARDVVYTLREAGVLK